jgi:hypothetical protein
LMSGAGAECVRVRVCVCVCVCMNALRHAPCPRRAVETGSSSSSADAAP